MDTIRVTGLLQASPNRVFEAWLSSHEHALFTGQAAEIDPKVNGEYTVFRGQLTGKILELKKNKLIVKTWRSREFPDDAKDSRVEIHFKKRKDGTTEIDILHASIPTGLGTKYEQGWLDRYLTPLRTYFADPNVREAAPPPKQPAAKKSSAKKTTKTTSSKKKVAKTTAKKTPTKKKAAKTTTKKAPPKKKAAKNTSSKKKTAKKTPTKKKTATKKAPSKKKAAKKKSAKKKASRRR